MNIEDNKTKDLLTNNKGNDGQTNKFDTALAKHDVLQRYLWELNKHSLLTRKEEKALAIRFRENGDKEAAYKLITSNLRLVIKIAMKFQRVWMQNLMDLIQEGNIGLMQALNKFDPYKEIKFSYYSSFWIKAYILKFIMDNWRLVKIGTTQAQRKLFFKLKKEKQALISMGFDPKPKLLSEKLGVTEGEIIEMEQRLDGWEVSLDAPIKEGSEDERISLLPASGASAETQIGQEEVKRVLGEKLEKFREQLNDRELQILDNRIFSDSPLTLQDLGNRYNVSRECIRQVEKNVIKKLREYFKKEIPDLESYREGFSVNETNLR